MDLMLVDEGVTDDFGCWDGVCMCFEMMWGMGLCGDIGWMDVMYDGFVCVDGAFLDQCRNLNYNSISGTIPSELGNLASLSFL